MRPRISKGRGRPRGKYRSSADFRLLEYLVLISTKYGTGSEELFHSFVEAWRHQESACKSLSIICRKKTRNHAIFLIIESLRVVAQFPVPTHILEETSPLTEFVSAKASRRAIVKRTKLKHLQIKDLKSGMKRISLEARVLGIPKPKSVVTRFGGFAKVTNASVADETGVIQLPLWNKQIDAVSVGDLVQIVNAHVVTYRGERQLRVDRRGQLNVVEER